MICLRGSHLWCSGKAWELKETFFPVLIPFSGNLQIVIRRHREHCVEALPQPGSLTFAAPVVHTSHTEKVRLPENLPKVMKVIGAINPTHLLILSPPY